MSKYFAVFGIFVFKAKVKSSLVSNKISLIAVKSKTKFLLSQVPSACLTKSYVQLQVPDIKARD